MSCLIYLAPSLKVIILKAFNNFTNEAQVLAEAWGWEAKKYNYGRNARKASSRCQLYQKGIVAPHRSHLTSQTHIFLLILDSASPMNLHSSKSLWYRESWVSSPLPSSKPGQLWEEYSFGTRMGGNNGVMQILQKHSGLGLPLTLERSDYHHTSSLSGSPLVIQEDYLSTTRLSHWHSFSEKNMALILQCD